MSSFDFDTKMLLPLNSKAYEKLQKQAKYNIFLYCFFEILNFIFLSFWAVILVPELFRKLRETPGNNFHLVSSKSGPGCPSYDQKTKKLTTKKITTIKFGA